jgi:cellobiose phosphorylase
LLARLLAKRTPQNALDHDRFTGPIRGELLGVEGLAERARSLARQQRTAPAGQADERGAPRAGPPVLLRRLDETQRLLESIRDTLGEAVERGADVSPAGDWLLDNFYVVQEHIREIREGMPKGYYRELPKLAAGTLAGYPRVYEIAIGLIAHTEGHVEFANIESFVREFQRAVTLTTGELWAMPTMLRLGLVENIRRMSLRTVQRLEDVARADRWAQRIRDAAEADAQSLTTAVAAFVGGHPPLTPAFIARFLQQIRAYQASWPPLVWLEQWISDEGMGAQDAVARSNQRLALTQVMMANSITSLRTIARLDWPTFVESLSAAEIVLRRDPAGTYPDMTFATRDHYRHVVEELARHAPLADHEVAQRALELAQRAAAGPDGSGPSDARTHHVGYYLVDEGRTVLEAVIGFGAPWTSRAYRLVLEHSETVYFGGILALTVLVLAMPLMFIRVGSVGAILAIIAAALIPANEVAISIIHQLITLYLPPRILPKLDFETAGIPATARTAIVVPILLGTVDAVKDALEHLEVQYLANRGSHLYFALLSDFTDSPTEVREGDAAILDAARGGIDALNTRYRSGTPLAAGDPFLLFHRSRRWNARQGVWMGWERKRGKLAEFNRYLRGGARDAFATIAGNPASLADIRYVITLDSDTVLPRGAAAALVGAMRHPLNRAVYDPASGRVVRGYGILQPRVAVSLPSANRSIFASIHSGHPGVDPYTTAVSDVYQDLFGEGSFTGKGIYDVDAFEGATHGRFPENTLLSHDLIEGAYARAALATDVEFYDDYPTRYLTFTRRKHRWIRGDWQLLRWLGRTVPGPDGPERNRLSAISQWKIFDNLRRSVVEIAQLALLVLGWTVLPGSPLLWTALVLLGLIAPWAFATTLAIVNVPRGKSWRAYYRAVARDAVVYLQQFTLAVVFLPHQAVVSADAIGRTLWRLIVTHRRLLEWQTASQVERYLGHRSPGEVWRRMGPAVGVVVLIAVAVIAHDVRTHTNASAVATVLIALWLGSPMIAIALSAPVVHRELVLSEAEAVTALRYALLHWHYFDRYVTSTTHWLAPDNYQEAPAAQVAMRTSPTNIGLQLLGTLSACDLGFLPSGMVIERLELIFRTLEQLPRVRGHFFNWYDLRTLGVLPPEYVSTVDSGNLAGHLIALKQACLALPDEPLFSPRVWAALREGLGMAAEELRGLASSGAIENPTEWQAVLESAERIRSVIASLAQAATEPPAIDAVQVLADRLRAAERVLQDRATAAVRESNWLTWGRTLLDRYAVELSAAGVSASGSVPTLRAAAATSGYAAEQVARLEALAARADAYAMEMDFRFLYDERRKLLGIGYHVPSETLDGTYYDLLASEARLASYFAIAKNDVPVEHWFYLGRSLTATSAGGDAALISWSGSMFEYLMPVLIMQSFPFTLLDQTYHAALRRQIAYGRERGVPWGFSESAYNVRDRNQVYQYRAFGVPGLALKRGLSKDLVVAPYATLLGLLVDPHESMRNLAALEAAGALGPFGFRDAVDYTRTAPTERSAVIGAYMAHHIGMSLVALTNALTRGVWWRRFHGDPIVRSAELLLCERVPRRLLLQEAQTGEVEEKSRRGAPASVKPAARAVETADTPEPKVALLGSVPYSVMITNGGGGYSRFASGADDAIAVTRWRADGTLDATGQWCYVKDVTPMATASAVAARADGRVRRLGRVWSAAYQPTGAEPDWYRVTFASDRATFQRRDGDIETLLEVAVVPDDAAEVRRVTLTNHGSTARDLELTSYAEVVLGSLDADRSHPAFLNLFVETEWDGAHAAILASRRPRSSAEARRWAVHVAAVGREVIGPVTCETDRALFLGRARSVRRPAALDDAADGVLSGTTGAVLDPIVALRARVRILPGQSARVTFTTLVADDRERALELADRYNDPYSAQRALDLSWMHAQVSLRELAIAPTDAALYQDIAGAILFPVSAFRAPAHERQAVRRGQDALWAHGISGDSPIVLAEIDTTAGLPAIRELLAAHQYWRYRGLVVDLVILCTDPPSYLREVEDAVRVAVLASSEAAMLDRPGGVLLLRLDLVPPENAEVIRATARVRALCDGRRLAEMFEVPESVLVRGPFFEPVRQGAGAVSLGTLAVAAAKGRLEDDAARSGEVDAAAVAAYPNGVGRLLGDGAYEICLSGDITTPAPWINVLANARAGCLISESGSACTFVENSQFFRLTPWHNDPVGDPCSETMYLRDDETGEVWSPTPLPVRHATPYIVRHEPGASTFEHTHAGITSTLVVGMAPDDPVRLAVLTLANDTTAPRRVTVTAYAEWTLGIDRERSADHVSTVFDRESESMFATNPSEATFADRVAFSALSAPLAGFTADRSEFLGRNGDRASPAGLQRAFLTEATGAGLDPCAALQTVIALGPGERQTVVWLLGAAAGAGAARALVDAYRTVPAAEAALAATRAEWRQRLAAVTVRTPVPELDAMLNGWLMYQALACRMWGRSALYQSGGAYGFRDQLQDAMALVYAEPGLAREHILRSAGRQFAEGDVQHWWHPDTGRGIRTRFSDDLVWLAFVADHYVSVTGDTSVLDERTPFLRMRPLAPDEVEAYERPEVSDETATVYEHCLRALRRASTVGVHGVPLIGCGDWNDGFNRIGIEGRGESVWMGWFLAATLRRFAGWVEARGEGPVAADLRARADAYVAAVERECWDGGWYRRAYFDDGTPLGSAVSGECTIDSIAQSWSVISGAGNPARAERAMAAVDEFLVREDARIILLLTPPFDTSTHDPGYIKGYVPGVRENGAQYTHAALWTVLAQAQLGHGGRAFDLFQMANPLTRTRTAADVARYKVEPYVVAADIYSASGHVGRGGWTWYTGSAAWMYRVGLEAILGFTKRGDTLRIAPCIPAAWDGFEIRYRYRSADYHIVVRNEAHVERGVRVVIVDGAMVLGGVIHLVDDARVHEVEVEMGPG